jgi:esterase
MARDRIPDCRLATIDGAGHQVHANRPEEFLGYVERFLSAPGQSHCAERVGHF